jgi:hypothetical protein
VHAAFESKPFCYKHTFYCSSNQLLLTIVIVQRKRDLLLTIVIVQRTAVCMLLVNLNPSVTNTRFIVVVGNYIRINKIKIKWNLCTRRSSFFFLTYARRPIRGDSYCSILTCVQIFSSNVDIANKKWPVGSFCNRFFAEYVKENPNLLAFDVSFIAVSLGLITKPKIMYWISHAPQIEQKIDMTQRPKQTGMSNPIR